MFLVSLPYAWHVWSNHCSGAEAVLDHNVGSTSTCLSVIAYSILWYSVNRQLLGIQYVNDIYSYQCCGAPQPRMTMARTLKLFKLPEQTQTPGIRPLEEKDVEQVRAPARIAPKNPTAPISSPCHVMQLWQ